MVGIQAVPTLRAEFVVDIQASPPRRITVGSMADRRLAQEQEA